MRILLDGHMIGEEETGNETYIANLASAIAETLSPDIFQIAVNREIVSCSPHYVPLNYHSNTWRLLYELPRLCHQLNTDLLHVTYFAPLLLACPFIVTVHDVSFRHFHSFFSLRDRLLFAALLPYTLHRAKAIITVSEHARAEITNAYPFVSDKLYVTHEAAHERFRLTQAKTKSVLIKYRIDSPYILAVGNLQPRKNLHRLIQAFGRIKSSRPEKLVIVGKAKWRASEIIALVKELELQERVIFTGYLPDDDLIALYNGATVFIYPSLYEGFGLPVLEAMSCGTPVIASSVSSIPEVAGNAAWLIDPMSVESITMALQAVLSDKQLAMRLRNAGQIRAAQFNWQKTAIETIDVYEKVLACV